MAFREIVQKDWLLLNYGISYKICKIKIHIGKVKTNTNFTTILAHKWLVKLMMQITGLQQNIK